MENNTNVRHFEYENSKAGDFRKSLIRIKPSKIIDGVGLFAVRDLKKGTIIAEADLLNEELFFSWDEFEKIDNESKKMIKDFCAESEDGFYAPRDINYISLPWHMNHCCDGNAGCDDQGNFVTIRDVKRDEELCYDYGFVKTNPKFRLECKCGSLNCRGIITGNDWKDSEYIKKNLIYMSPEVREVLLKQEI